MKFDININLLYYIDILHFPFSFKVAIISLKLLSPDSKFSMISPANTSGSGKLSRSVRLLSLSQKISKLVLSLARISV